MTKPGPLLGKVKERAKDDSTREETQTSVGLFELLRFSTALDRVLLIIATLGSVTSGMGFPMLAIFFGKICDEFVNAGSIQNFLDGIRDFLDTVNFTRDDVMDDPALLRRHCQEIDVFYNQSGKCGDMKLDEVLSDAIESSLVAVGLIGASVFIGALCHVALWTITAERQANRIRREFLANVLRQDIGWFDINDVTQLNSRLSGDIVKIQNGIGDKAGTVVQYLTNFVGGYLVGFIYGWKLSLVMVAISPAIFVAAGLFSYFSVSMTAKEQRAYAKAGGIAEQALSSIRTVLAFGGEEKEADQYQNNLGEAEKFGRNKGLAIGLSIGLLGTASFATYALAFWYGGKLIREDDYDVNDVTTVFVAIFMGTFALGVAAPGVQCLVEARAAASVVFRLIDLKSPIDSSSDKGLRPFNTSGNIRFKNVHFSYPARPDVKVLKGVSVEAKPGQTVALVGSSGSGKSTMVQLLLRFYDPHQGQVLVDGIDVKELNIKWLRQNIGLVSQEPTLFDTTIQENIRYGNDGVTTEEIVQAARDANAFDFISQLPDKFNTLVGEGGAQLSGGQKQRIAIARALVRNPKILLLDEATSALDTGSEAIVQDALDKASQGRTTLIIAHRLSTIKNADVIIGMEKGIVKETGSHEELMAKQGIYYTLVMNQIKGINEEGETIEHGDNDATQQNGIIPRDDVLGRKRCLSFTSQPEEDEYQIDEELPEVTFLQLMQLNSPEWPFLALACVGAVGYGLVQPAFAYCLAKMFESFSEDDHEMKDEVRKYSLYMLILGAVSFCTSLLANWMFAIAGGSLTRRIRVDMFRAMMRQEMAWFDKTTNSVGCLTSRLANDTALLQAATGLTLGAIIQCIAAVTGAMTLALIIDWLLTLVTISFFPLLLVGGYMQHKLIGGNVGSTKEALEGAGKTAVEAIENVRTVASLTKEESFKAVYDQQLERLLKSLRRNALLLGLVFGFSQGMVFLSVIATFAFGAHMIENGDIDAGDVFKVFLQICYSGFFLGQATNLGPDFGKAAEASRRIFYMLQRRPEIDTHAPGGIQLPPISFKSTVEIRDAHFRYPNRPHVKVLQGLNVKVKPGQTVALVGSSGCGKSTCIALLERFYDASEGQVLVGNYKIQDLNTRWLRAQIGLVSQEPVLFDRSISENIAYGDNSRKVPMDEIIRAARNANVHDFIQALPNGYHTNVGDKGTQLSGGQKQRVAIARALVRNPKILLLDEATSALDTESEKIVQEALDKAREGRTCITIAHRLSTIQDADRIVVIHQGQVAEQGTHSQLLALRGHYFQLYNVQSKA